MQFNAPPVQPDAIDLSRLAGPLARNNVIQKGDQLNVTIATGIEERSPPEWPLRVSQSGTVNVPIVGMIEVSGMTFTGAEQAIREAGIARGKFVSPNVTVVLQKRHVNLVTVWGAVNDPGTHKLPAAGSDLLAALVAAGGLREDASPMVEIWHPAEAMRNTIPPDGAAAATRQASFASPLPGAPTGARRVSFDVSEVDGAGQGFPLDDGTVVQVLPLPHRKIQVIGLVNRPDQFEVPADQDVRLLDAVAKAGGRTLQIADKVKIIRQIPETGESITIGASVRQAKRNGTANIRLAAGDVISVEETPMTFVVETLRSFVRFGFSSTVPGF